MLKLLNGHLNMVRTHEIGTLVCKDQKQQGVLLTKVLHKGLLTTLISTRVPTKVDDSCLLLGEGQHGSHTLCPALTGDCR